MIAQVPQPVLEKIEEELKEVLEVVEKAEEEGKADELEPQPIVDLSHLLDLPEEEKPEPLAVLPVEEKPLGPAFTLALFLLILASWGFVEFSINLATWFTKHRGWAEMDPGLTMTCLAFGSLLCSLVCAMLYSVRLGLARPPRRAIALALSQGFLMGIGYFGYSVLASELDASGIAPFVSMYMVVPVAIGVLWRGESLSRQKAFGIGLAIVSMGVIGLDTALHSEHDPLAAPDLHDDIQPKTDKSPVYFALALLGFGLSSTCGSLSGVTYAKAIASMSVLGCTGYLLCGIVVSIAFYGHTPATLALAIIGHPSRTASFVTFCGAFYVIGNYGFLLMAQLCQEVSTVAPLTALYTIVPTILGMVVLNEPVFALRIVGIVMAATAVLILSMSKAKRPKHNVVEVFAENVDAEVVALEAEAATSLFPMASLLTPVALPVEPAPELEMEELELGGKEDMPPPPSPSRFHHRHHHSHSHHHDSDNENGNDSDDLEHAEGEAKAQFVF